MPAPLQSGTETGKFAYNDSYALLSGFPPDQEAWGEARITKPNSKCNQEVEILLRFSSSPHNTTGYECLARCTDDSSSYLEIVRWDGPLGKFTYLSRNNGKGFGLKNGDTLNASIVGNVITVFINGVKKAEATDYTFKTGNPGIGEFLACRNAQGLGTNAEFGFASFTARGIGPARGAGASGSRKRSSTLLLLLLGPPTFRHLGNLDGRPCLRAICFVLFHLLGSVREHDLFVSTSDAQSFAGPRSGSTFDMWMTHLPGELAIPSFDLLYLTIFPTLV